MNEQICVRHPSSPSRSIKLPIIYNGDLCIALSKPANFPCKGEWFSILEQIWAGLQKPSIGRLNLEHPDMVYNLEGGASGILLIAKNKGAIKILKNAYGSYLFEFTFDLLCEKSPCNKEAEIACSLPIARHTSKEMMLISAKMGKKSYTAFNFIESVDRYEHWQAKCTYLRRDQICLHAHESGLAVLGDEKYGGTQIPLFAELKRNFKANRKKNNEFPYSGLMVHLSALKLHDGTLIHSELPKKMRVFMKFLANS